MADKQTTASACFTKANLKEGQKIKKIKKKSMQFLIVAIFNLTHWKYAR